MLIHHHKLCFYMFHASLLCQAVTVLLYELNMPVLVIIQWSFGYYLYAIIAFIQILNYIFCFDYNFSFSNFVSCFYQLYY